MKLTVKAKLIGGFLLVALIALAIGGVGYWGMGRMNYYLSEIADVRMVKGDTLRDIQSGIFGVAVGERFLMNNRIDAEIRKAQFAYMEKHMKRIEDAWAIYEPMPRSEAVNAIWNPFVAGFKAWRTEHDAFVGMANEKEKMLAEGIAPTDPRMVEMDDKIFKEYLKVRLAYIPLEKSIGELLEINNKNTEIAKAEANAALAQTNTIIVTTIVVGVIVAIALGIWLSTAIVRVLNEVKRAAAQVASGDMTDRVHVKNKDEFGELADSLNRMVEQVGEVIAKVRSAAEQIAAASEEMSSSAQNVSSGAQNQASTVEEISASVEELTSSISDVAKSAQQANVLAEDTSRNADSGGKAVNESVEATKMIARSSEQISEIIGTIGEIADQTNLLALNAAIEAARAGEHGMGFAVVADEVRKLAERSSQAAREITTLIKESSGKVQEGTKLATAAGEQLKSIVEGVEKTAGAIAQISSATEEQTATADEVAKAIQNVSAITEENSGAAEEMASSSEELAAQAEALRKLVEHFKVA